MRTVFDEPQLAGSDLDLLDPSNSLYDAFRYASSMAYKSRTDLK